MKRFTKTNSNFSVIADDGKSKGLNDVYGRYSDYKQLAYKHCRALEEEVTQIKPCGTILSANSQTFNYGFIACIACVDIISSRTGEIVEHIEDYFLTQNDSNNPMSHNILAKFKITACYDYCALVDVGEDQNREIKIPAHCFAVVTTISDTEFIVE